MDSEKLLGVRRSSPPRIASMAMGANSSGRVDPEGRLGPETFDVRQRLRLDAPERVRTVGSSFVAVRVRHDTLFFPGQGVDRFFAPAAVRPCRSATLRLR